MPFYKWPRNRTAVLTTEQAADVILHCTEASQDTQFAWKYGVTPSCIRSIRTGRTWCQLREKLKTGWRP